MTALPIIEWQDCYNQQWRDRLTKASFTHPAKFAPGLLERILRHGIEKGYWTRGQRIGDPFGGVACGGVIAQYQGLEWVGVELEAKFVEIAQANIKKHAQACTAFNFPVPQIIQGDSRDFAQVVAGIVTSPPFTPCASGRGMIETGYEGTRSNTDKNAGQRQFQGKGGDRADANIERLNAGNLAAVVTSPPYIDSISPSAGGADTQHPDGRIRAMQGIGERYGNAPAQIGHLKAGEVVDGFVTSPPYASTRLGETVQGGDQDEQLRRPKWREDAYGVEPAQIGNLANGKLAAVVTSPPWERNCEGAVSAHKFKDPEAFQKAKRGHGASDDARRRQLERDTEKTYGNSPGQIGRDAGETYWQAMAKVYASCYRSLRPGGYMAVVVKDYVKRKKRVALCDDTLRLLLHVGFVGVERARALLVSEQRDAGLFGADVVKTTERKSFFRRVQEGKGSPKIDWEEVLFVRKP